jgi:two-component system CheB/CheR fusion protein
MPLAGQGSHSNPKLANVLLVDDREDDITLARLLLFHRRGLNCNLHVANDAAQALDLLCGALRRHDPIHLILLDINMPGMDGFELMERLQQYEELKETPIVMLSGSTYQKDKQRAANLGAVGYLEKPPRIKQFREIVDQIATVGVETGDQGDLLVQC